MDIFDNNNGEKVWLCAMAFVRAKNENDTCLLNPNDPCKDGRFKDVSFLFLVFSFLDFLSHQANSIIKYLHAIEP
jgi:hypothetical protein